MPLAQNKNYYLVRMIAVKKISFNHFNRVLLLAILVGCAEPENKTALEEEEEKQPDYEIWQPDSVRENLKYYTIYELHFSLPTGFYVRKYKGPDFVVYSIGFPGGIKGGIAHSWYPDLPSRLTELTSDHSTYLALRSFPGSSYFSEPFRRLDSIGYYTEEFPTIEPIPYTKTYEFNRIYAQLDVFSIPHETWEKFHQRDTLILEASKGDSLIIWKSYPRENKPGAVDVLFDPEEQFAMKTHFFVQSNTVITTNEILNFVVQLEECFK